MPLASLGPLIGAVDQGTSSSRFLVFSASTAELITYHKVSINCIHPENGWIEQDPNDILDSVIVCINNVVDNLKLLEIDPVDIVSIGITNQRETSIVWDKFTGRPLYNAIVWNDTRTSSTVQSILDKLRCGSGGKNILQHRCGLPISTYFSALKLKWLIESQKHIAQAIEENRLLFGTVDSWLIWNLTGGPNGTNSVHMTDVTNASRTMLMNIETLEWDPILCSFFDIPPKILPQIRSSSEIYGTLVSSALAGVPISGCLGDQQSALLGQNCLKPGQAKNTYGTGCFLLYNVGHRIIYSNHGIISTVAYKLGPNAPVVYALEGSVAGGGSIMSWMKDIVLPDGSFEACDKLASQVEDSADVFFVPAFSGLFAPHWRPDARGIIVGLTYFSSRAHICRSAYEAISFQTREVLEAMVSDSNLGMGDSLLVDGGLASNDLLMKIQADILGITIIRPSMAETTALGAAMAAGQAEGIDVWDIDKQSEVTVDKFLPRLTEEQRNDRYERWRNAVSRTLNWASTDTSSRRACYDKNTKIYSSVSCAIFAIFCFMFVKYASKQHHKIY